MYTIRKYSLIETLEGTDPDMIAGACSTAMDVLLEYEDKSDGLVHSGAVSSIGTQVTVEYCIGEPRTFNARMPTKIEADLVRLWAYRFHVRTLSAQLEVSNP